ncbi:hypothetical protein HPP92_011626 [Vanilla planifolia]|uniref:Uncharacterized protein n=1 Tax=Vanilla planifolia TaxID=51239 RepID=A0A835R6E5_VANPL|nr:hypothetical protein HPP92_011626 [Vanilla planifolia]
MGVGIDHILDCCKTFVTLGSKVVMSPFFWLDDHGNHLKTIYSKVEIMVVRNGYHKADLRRTGKKPCTPIQVIGSNNN